jgi:hypothetical protein
MLDVRPTAYVVPIAEQEIASLTPLVLIVNTGTVAALVTGHVHIYRDSTGLRLYTSELAITTIAAGTSSTVPALTPWAPPAPADDDYFIMCDITATATTPHEPPGRVEQLGPYTFDIKPAPMGPVPATHHTTHEAGGMDEIDLTGMHGILGDLQPVDAHASTHEIGGTDPVLVEYLGTAEMNAALVLAPNGTGGIEFRTEAGGGGGPTPTGTGFRHVAAGVEDAAAKLVENVDVHATAAIAESKLNLNYATHARQHAITATADHTSGATSGKLMKADANGLPVDATNTDTQLANTVRQFTPQTLTDQAAIDWDLAAGGAAKVTLAGNRTMNAPTNMVEGAWYRLRIIQDATGTRLITWNAVFKWPGAVAPALSAAPNNIDIIYWTTDGTSMFCIGMTSALA